MKPVKHLAKVHIAKKDLGLDEETYRDIVQRVTGHPSAGECTERQLDELLGEFKRLGWTPKPKGRKPLSKSPRVRKIWALWNQMCKDGLVRVEGHAEQRTALRAFVVRMTGVTDPEWLKPAQASQVIEGLKAWRNRGTP
jgi:phage gp16-like protein